MKSTKVLVVLALAVIFTVFATTAVAAPLRTGTELYLDSGTGSGANAPCATGSCFGMNQGPGLILWADIAPGNDLGVIIGKDQQPGSTTGGPEMGDITDAWSFFGNPGTFATAAFSASTVDSNGNLLNTSVTTNSSANSFDDASCVDAAGCLGKTTLGTWHVSWNGVAVPLGSALGCLSLTNTFCTGVSEWTLDPSPAVAGAVPSTFVLRYGWSVPNNDPSGFGNVPFFLILRGVAMTADLCETLVCNDNNACTQNLCDPSTGCYYPPVANGTTCNDGNLCTSADKCQNGVCKGTVTMCEPCGPCATSSCVTSTGMCRCTAFSGGTCNDNNACTLSDTCVSGVCKGTAKNCSDNNVCTTDTCDTATGVCTSTPGAPTCGLACVPETQPGMALLPLGTLLEITQGVGSLTNTPCSAGSCFSMEMAAGIVAWTDFGPGTDGGIVVGKSQLSGGQETNPDCCCNLATPGELSSAWGFFNNCGSFFTAPDGGTKDIYCNTSCTGADCLYKTELKVFNMAFAGTIIPMGSEAGCTLASCSNDQKEGIFVNSYTIDPVIGRDWSINYSQVVPSGSFTGVKFTAIMRGKVIWPGDDVCDDNNICTDDILDPASGICVHTFNTLPCDDGNACTVPDTCRNGICMPGSHQVDCLDFNNCTSDACDPAVGCVHTPRICNDNNACTSDTCNYSTGCVYTPINCNDNNACTTDTCNSATGACMHTPIFCTDNNACTIDSCNTATGCVYTPISCDDNYPCTADSCDSATGACIHTPIPGCDPQCAGKPNGTSCFAERYWYDPSVCYNDYCSNGVCVMGIEQHCDDNNACTSDLCDQAIGACTYSPLADGSPCTLDNQPGSCTAGQCIPYPACPAGSVKQVLTRGGGQKPSGADLQIQTLFTVMNTGCIIPSPLACTPGTILQVNFRVGYGPNPTSGTLNGNPIDIYTNLMITCNAGEVYKLVLDNKDAAGGKDVDRITINVQ